MVFGRLGENSAGSATKSRILGGNYTNLMSKGVRLPPSIPKKSADQDLKNLPTGAADILSGARRVRGGASRVPARVPAAERGDLLDLLRPEPQWMETGDTSWCLCAPSRPLLISIILLIFFNRYNAITGELMS